jgi:CspA family cold shock protein
LSQPRDLSGRDDNALADRLDLPCNEKSSARFAALSRGAHLATGTVKWFNATKGFGFIQPDAVGADVFVHISAVERADMRDLNEGQKIAYEVVADRRTGKSSADNLQPA